MTIDTTAPVNLAAALLEPNLVQHPHKTAYVCNGETVSYQQLAVGACRFAAWLQQAGIEPGDRVLLILPDSPVCIAAFLGTVLQGAIAVPVNTTLTADEYRYIREDCAARFLLVSPSVPAAQELTLPGVARLVCPEQLHGWLEEYLPVTLAAPPPPAEAFAFMLYTSGSTGKPKGVPHHHHDLLTAAQQYGKGVLQISADDVLFSSSKLSFAYGLGNSLAFPLYAGATALLHPGKPTPDDLLALIEKHRPSLFFSVPTVYSQIILRVTSPRLSLPMRLCIAAGEALPSAIFDEWRRLTGLELLDGIGSTEATHIFISNYPGRSRSGSAGELVPGYEARLVDDEGTAVTPGTPGHLLIRGNSLAPCYWNLPHKTTATMLPDGFIRTGDIFAEQEGYFYHRGRSDDMLKAGGQWISPIQVEEAIRMHPAVADCAVAACHVVGLERPAAWLVLKQDVAPQAGFERELRRFLAPLLAEHMLPVKVHLVDDLPRTATGKVQRFKLKS